MSHDAIGAQNSEYRPLTPLNTIHGRSNNGLKAHKQVKVKETKPAMEICDVKINDATMDLELAGRLTTTAIDQFLFFMNQVPFPVSRLAKVPAANAKTVRLRSDFMTAHTRLSNDVKSALGFSTEVAEGCTPPPIRIVVTLGSIMMPKSAMLFQLPAVQRDSTKTPNSVAAAALMTHISHSSASVEVENELPPDSDSDRDHDEQSDEESDALNSQPSGRTAPSTTPVRSPFTPFCDADAASTSNPSSRLTSPAPTSQPRLSSRQNLLTRSPVYPETPNLHPSNYHPISDENQTSKSRLEKRFRVAERELTVVLSNLDLFTEEIELSKIHVYLQASRSYKGNGWHPRASAAKTLDSLVRFPNVDASARTKLDKMNACAIRVALTHSEPNASGPSYDLNDAEEYIWLEWDGKLAGVE